MVSGAWKSDSALGSALFGQTRRRLLSIFFTRPDESFYLRQIARLSGAGIGGLQRELARLTQAGILRREPRGNQVSYRADPACPIFGNLCSLIVKTAGVGDVLREALAPVAGKILIAFVFGSFARGEHRGSSDVDVMVVSQELEFGELVVALKPAEATVGREINPTLYRPDELRAKINAGHHFVLSVLRSERVWLIGSEHELERIAPMAAVGVAASARDEQAGNRPATGAGGA